MRLAVVVCAVFPSLFAQVPPETDKLPVKRVVLYKNGVGYFEHLGRVQGNENVSVGFTSGQLNDVLKSLTVLDLDGGRIAGVAYGSAAPVDRQLGDLRLAVGEKTSLTEFLAALRGAKLEVRSSGGVITGRLLSVERKTRMGSGATLEVDYVSLLTESGEVKTTEVSPSFSLRLLDRGLAGKVDRYLDVVGASREADVRRMVISTEGTGERSIFVSYISEVPVWKATYRIVLSPKRPPLLQGWAIVDNTVGEDWNNVQLSLVAGAPQSFVQNLSQPFYARRPVVPLPEALAIAPQTYEATLIPSGARIAGVVTDQTGAAIAGADVQVFDAAGSVVGQVSTNAEGRYEIGGLPDSPLRVQVQRAGFNRAEINNVIAASGRAAQQDVQLRVGATTETVEVTAAAASTINTESASVTGGRNLGNGSTLGASLNSRLPTKKPAPGGGFGGGSYNVDAARAQMEAAARAQELGDLFE